MLKEQRIRKRLRDDFEHYASKCLNITTKDGKLIPFILNKAQKYIHQRLEEQLTTLGRVRAIILKGRQQGCSTYVGGRFFWKTTHRKNIRTFILTHQQPATQNLYAMVKRFYEHCPYLVKPSTSTNNATELDFNKLGSGYRVSTAGSIGVGRSSTLQYFHGSEVAFWANADDHMSGIFQAVPDSDKTEIILESTANGADGLFYKQCMAAQNGETDYQLIFVPWYWQDEYVREVPEGTVWTEDESTYQEAFDVTEEQLYWRRIKINEFYGDIGQFRREYPASIDEAFKAEVEGALWQRKDFKHITVEQFDAMLWQDGADEEVNEDKYAIDFTVIGYDPAVTGTDTSDEHGLITVSRLDNDMIYVRRDSSARMKPKDAVPKVLKDYELLDADRIRVEVNNGGDWIPDAINMVDENAVTVPIHAKKNKKLRAHPVAQAYRQGRVVHVGHFHALEDEMCSWVFGVGASPNRIDAAVYAILDCLDLDGDMDLPPAWSTSNS